MSWTLKWTLKEGFLKNVSPTKRKAYGGAVALSIIAILFTIGNLFGIGTGSRSFIAIGALWFAVLGAWIGCSQIRK